MSNSISKSLNMRTMKEAMADQEEYETAIEPIEEIDEDLYQIEEYNAPAPSALDRANKDLTCLDQEVYEHTKETDDVIDKAKTSFDTIVTLAQSVPPDKSARLFEVAAQYLDIINKSSDSKVSAKHDRAKLSISLTKAQMQAGLVENAVTQGIKAHRNDILKAIMGGETKDADFVEDSDSEENK